MKSKNRRKGHLSRALHRGRFGRCGELQGFPSSWFAHPPWNLGDWPSLTSPSERFQTCTRHHMRLGPKQTTNSMYSHAQSACWSNMFTNSRYILAILRLTRCHVQSKWILDSDSATRVSCIELFSASLCPWHLLRCFPKCRIQENCFVGCRLSFYKKKRCNIYSDHLWTRTWAKIRKQQCQQILNWNWTSRHCSRWSQFVVLDLVGQQVQPGATLHSKTFNREPSFIISTMLTVQARICGVLVSDRKACRAWQLFLELHQRAGQEIMR